MSSQDIRVSIPALRFNAFTAAIILARSTVVNPAQQRRCLLTARRRHWLIVV